MMRSIITFLLLLLGSTAFAVAANTIELDESIFTGSYTNATGSYSDLYF